jgi:hypothetical protein
MCFCSTTHGVWLAGVTVAGAISLFPRAYPAAATAITRGVQVRVCMLSVLFTNEGINGKVAMAQRMARAIIAIIVKPVTT